MPSARTGSRRRTRPPRRALGAGAIAICALAVAVAGCGGDDAEQSAGAEGGGPTTVKVGVLPIGACAPFYLGIEQGFFEQAGLEVEPHVASTGAAILPAINAGELQFGFSSVPALMQADTEGLAVKLVAQGSQAGPGESSRFEGVLVKDDGPIRSPRDLADATIAVNSIESIGPLMIDAALEKLGVDTSEIEYTEIPFSEANAALATGRVDAAYQTEPFITQAQKDGGMRVVLNQYEVLAPKILIAAYFTTGEYAEQNPDVVARFQRAMNRSLRYASEHPDEVRDIVLTFTEIPPDLAKDMVLPGWGTTLDPARNGLQLVADLAVEAGAVDQPPDLDEMIVR